MSRSAKGVLSIVGSLYGDALKIVQLVTRNCTGGVQVVAGILDSGFCRAGNDSSVWFFCDSDEQILPLPNAKFLFQSKPNQLYYLRLLWRLFWQFRREKPDIVLAHTTNTAVPGLLLATLAGIKKRVAVQHNPLDTYSFLARTADRQCANLGIYWRNVVVANAVLKTTAGYTDRAANHVRLIHNGMPMPLQSSKFEIGDRQVLYRKFHLPPDGPLVAAIGRLAEQKNVGTLIEVMRPLKNVTLAIAGDGPLRETIQEQIIAAGLDKNIHMLGVLSATEVRQLLRASDIFVTPSHFEAMPMTVLEAMQEGAVIIASDIEAHQELIGESGILVPATADNFRDELLRLLYDPALCAELSERAVRRASLFTDDAMLKSYLALATEATSS